MKRAYVFHATRPGGFMFWPGRIITCDARIRVVALIMFRKWFGHWPNDNWHKDGFMAECRDKRGNCIQLEQLNVYERWKCFAPGGNQLLLCDRGVKA